MDSVRLGLRVFGCVGHPGRGDGRRVTSLEYPDRLISTILKSVKTIAMVGVNANPMRPAHIVMAYLISRGYQVIPINPGLAGKELLGQTVYRSLTDVPTQIDMVDIFRRVEVIDRLVDEALSLDPLPRVIWMQFGLRHDGAAARAEAAGLTVIMDRCPKVEFGRLAGENSWLGLNSGRISSRAPRAGVGYQRLSLPSAD
ncbi:MAG: CoA-binding protein [Hyphomicrobiales bacterium]|nr:CoA-binding protein [Hyphomicrobiales bacterium]